jgi:hypothetical protein
MSERASVQEHFLDLCALFGQLFPATADPPGAEPTNDSRVAAIGEDAQRLVELRDRWLNPPGLADAELKKRTLTDLYNTRSTWLANAHATLDRAVLDAYGWLHDLPDDDLLARLLALNAERAGHAPSASSAATERAMSTKRSASASSTT